MLMPLDPRLALLETPWRCVNLTFPYALTAIKAIYSEFGVYSQKHKIGTSTVREVMDQSSCLLKGKPAIIRLRHRRFLQNGGRSFTAKLILWTLPSLAVALGAKRTEGLRSRCPEGDG